MVDVASKVLQWSWTFSWIIMFIPINFCITFSFTNITWNTRTIPFTDNTRSIIVLIFQRKYGSHISGFPYYYNSETIVSEFMKSLQKLFWVNFIEFTVGYFNRYERFCNFKQTRWNYKIFISIFFTLLKLIIYIVNEK